MHAEINRFAYAVWSFLFYLNPKDTARTAAWRAQDLAEMDGVSELDTRAVGKLIGAGMQHRIYEYHATPPMVLKIATPIPLLRFPTYADARSDMEHIAQFFEPYHVSPARALPLNNSSYVIQQRRLENFSVLTPNSLQDAAVRAQFLDVVERNARLRRDAGRSLDFLGREGQRKCRAALLGLRAMPTIANLVVEQHSDNTRQLRVLDTDLENFYPRATTWHERRSGFAARLAVGINRFFIQRFFDLDIGA